MSVFYFYVRCIYYSANIYSIYNLCMLNKHFKKVIIVSFVEYKKFQFKFGV